MLRGGAGNDQIVGRGGNDSLDGGEGNDNLRGGADADIFRGGNGNDAMFGMGGADRFVFDNNDGFDRIADFDRASGDRFVIEGGTAADITITATGFTFGATTVQVFWQPRLTIDLFDFV